MVNRKPVWAPVLLQLARFCDAAGKLDQQTDRSVSTRNVNFPDWRCQDQNSCKFGNPGRCVYAVRPMAREATIDSRQEILRTAARLFQQRGYDATSMNDVAAALKLSKGGLYHHFQSKDEILFEIMNHAMEITQERVLNPVRGHRRSRRAPAHPDPAAHRSRAQPARPRNHRDAARKPSPAAGAAQAHQRPQERLHSLPRKPDRGSAAGPSRPRAKSSPRAAAFALLGMINWIYQWYKPEGALQEEHLVRQYTDIFFGGASRERFIQPSSRFPNSSSNAPRAANPTWSSCASRP